jgi:hypothetical protein
MRASLIVSLLLTAALIAAAQEPPPVAVSKGASSIAAKSKATAVQPAKPKLTDEQKRGLSLLETAEASAGELEAPSRIVAYTQIARIYQKTNPKKAIDLLQHAYESLQNLQFDSPNSALNTLLKTQLQKEVLNQYASAAPERVDALLDHAEPAMRQEMLRVLLPYYEKNKNLDRPVSVLMQLAVEAEMPYDIANDVMDKLAPSRSDQIRQLFLASLSSYQNHQHLGVSPDIDFANLISKAYGKVPDESVETAIDELLSQARKADEKNANVSISMGFNKGALQFKSIYDTQLFAVLPTLQQVDPAKAKRLLQERQDVNTFASKYPQGMNSLDKSGRPTSFGVNTGNGGAGMQSSILMEQQQMNAVMKEAANHPNDALANAAALKPQWAIAVYLNIAHANVKKDTTVATTALAKAQDLLTQTSVSGQADTLTDIIRTYEALGDKQKAQNAIERGTKTLMAMYRQESDADDPNLAPEACWVSTEAWGKLIGLEYELNPAQSADLLQEVPDDEVRVFAQIALAKRMMGNTSPMFYYTVTARKDGMMMFRIPGPVTDKSK